MSSVSVRLCSEDNELIFFPILKFSEADSKKEDIVEKMKDVEIPCSNKD